MYREEHRRIRREGIDLEPLWVSEVGGLVGSGRRRVQGSAVYASICQGFVTNGSVGCICAVSIYLNDYRSPMARMVSSQRGDIVGS